MPPPARWTPGPSDEESLRTAGSPGCPRPIRESRSRRSCADATAMDGQNAARRAPGVIACCWTAMSTSSCELVTPEKPRSPESCARCREIPQKGHGSMKQLATTSRTDCDKEERGWRQTCGARQVRPLRPRQPMRGCSTSATRGASSRTASMLSAIAARPRTQSRRRSSRLTGRSPRARRPSTSSRGSTRSRRTSAACRSALRRGEPS